MKTKTILIVLFLAANVFVFIGIRHWHSQKKEQSRIMLRDATRYAGVQGQTITAFDNRTNRWIAEMKEESLEVTLQKLTDAAEYFRLSGGYQFPFRYTFENERGVFCSADIGDILGNRRFRKAFKDIEKTNRKRAAELLTQNIRENLAELHSRLMEYKDLYSQGGTKGPDVVMGTPDDDSLPPYLLSPKSSAYPFCPAVCGTFLSPACLAF